MYRLKQPRLVAFALATVVGLMAMGLAGPADAQSLQTGRSESKPSRSAGVPLLAVVALSSQRVTVYDARGKILEAPVSTGQSGYETPAGIYSVIEKHRDHYSNIYDGAAMPFMQRLTWSGIALHAGALPGYPASHGCIRMPHGFAGHLFERSRMGMRVVVVRDDMAPVDFAHPVLFKPAEPSPAEDRAGGNSAAVTPPTTPRSIAAAKMAAAEAAAEKAEVARRAAAKAREQAAEFEEDLEEAEAAKVRAEGRIEEVERLLQAEDSSAPARKLAEIKAKAQERLARAQAKIDAIYAEGKAVIDAALAARQEAKAAAAANAAAQDEARLVASQLAPLSVFISRKTQRLYVRQGFQPLFESAVTIGSLNTPIGTTLFMALAYTNGDADLRWSALSMYSNAPSPSNRGGGPGRTNADAAKAALERISLPQDTIDRINELITPGSALIISDEAMSRETGKGTDFVVLMSGEPQGGIKRRPRTPYLAARGYGGVVPPGGYSSPFLWW